MEEAFPHGFGADDSKEGSSKKKDRLDGPSLPSRPLIERSQGDTPHKHEARFLRPLHEAAKPPEQAEQPPEPAHIARPEQTDFEREQGWRQTSPEELAGMAAAEAEALRRLREHTPESADDEDDEVDDTDGKSMPQARMTRLEPASEMPADYVGPAGESARQTEPDAANAEPAESFEDMLKRAMPAEFGQAASGDRLSNEAAPDVPVHESPADMPAAETFHAASDFESSRSSGIPNEGPETEAAFRAIANRPELADLADIHMPDTTPLAEMTGRGPRGPNRVRTPSGRVVDPVTYGALAALGVRERFNSMKHTMVEAALLGGGLLLAAGVAGEHIRARRRERALQKDIDRQGKRLNQADQQLQQEQLRHTQTRDRLETLAAAQAAVSSHAHEASMPGTAAAETAAGTGLISAAAAAELAARVGEPAETPQSRSAADHELAYRLKHSRELGRAIERNPELRDQIAAAGAETMAAPAESPTQKPHELRELVDASAYADALRRGRNYEHLQTEPANDSAHVRPSDTAALGLSATAQTPRFDEPELPAGEATPLLTARAGETSARSSRAKSAAIATILIILAVLLAFAFAR
jgi:hypothetical protein